MNITPIILALMGLLTAIASGAGGAALVRVFVVEKKTATKDEMEGYRVDNRNLRQELNNEIESRRRDREYYEGQLAAQEKRFTTRIDTLNSNWDACRAECQRLRQLVEGKG